MDAAWGGLGGLAAGLQSGLGIGQSMKEAQQRDEYNKKMAEIQAKLANVSAFGALAKAGTGGTTIENAITGKDPVFNKRMEDQAKLEEEASKARSYAEALGATTNAYEAMGKFGASQSPTDVIVPPSGLQGLIPTTQTEAAGPFAKQANIIFKEKAGTDIARNDKMLAIYGDLTNYSRQLQKQLTDISTQEIGGMKSPAISLQKIRLQSELDKTNSQRNIIGKQLGIPEVPTTRKANPELQMMLNKIMRVK